MAILLTTVIILSVSVQNACAAPEKSTDNLFNRVMNFKETILMDMAYLRIFMDKISGNNGNRMASEESVDNSINFVIEQVPLDQVLGSDTKKSKSAQKNDVNPSTNDNKNKVQSKNTVKTISNSRSTGNNILREDLEILARIIYAEARGESFEGKVAVGAVVLNRVQHPDFPKSIREVVYQPGQFTAVVDKQIELIPDESAYQAAEAALEGQDPSKGAIYYYNPKIATDQWIKKRNIVCSIGNHRFCV
ncbi:MAG: spore cortex-lytic protein [Peptococcaceae bacterium]|nr:spore cortex-lytic protein [Peptococcaceae bacterium]